MKQQTFTDIEYSNRKRRTKRDEFLSIMEEIIPWEEWVEYVKPCYYDNKVGRPARGIETMLRMYLLQTWFNLSDEAVEDAIYDSYSFRSFMKIDFIDEQAPDATTLCKFRRILLEHNIANVFFEAVNALLEKHGQLFKGGTILDATIIDAPSSTKNRNKARDPEMHQTKKGNQWRFGMKAHIGTDAATGYVHSVVATPANAHDITQAHKLIRKDDEVVYGDSAYIGLGKREEICSDPDKAAIDCRINERPSKYRTLPQGVARDFAKNIERGKSSVRAKVEYPFLIVKGVFGYKKTVYRGIEKNLHRLKMLFCSANLLMCARSGGWREI